MKTPASKAPVLRRFCLPIITGLIAVLLLVPGAFQARADILEEFNKGVGLMQENKFAEGSAVFDDIIKTYGGAGAYDSYGAAFGVMYYHRALCSMVLGKYKEAGKDFETCIKDFPNKTVAADKVQSINKYHTLAFFQWGRSEQAAEEYAGALALYEKFLSKKPERGTYSPAELYTNMAICQIKLDKIPEGTATLTQVIGAFTRLKEQEKNQVYLAFLELATKWVEHVLPKEGIEFMDTNEFAIRYSPSEMIFNGYNVRLLKLAQSCIEADKGMEGLGLRFMSFLPRMEDAIAELEQQQFGFSAPAVKERAKERIKKLQDEIASGKHIDITVYRILAYAWEKLGDTRAAYAVYDYMAQNYENAVIKDGEKEEPFHPEIVYNAARTSFYLGDINSAQHHALLFLAKYPGHKLEDQVREMLLEQLFLRGEYLRCIEITDNMLPRQTKGTPRHDLCLYVRGGSFFYEAMYPEAQPLLDEHVQLYPDSTWRAQTLYYQAGNQVKLLEWKKAAGLLDTWLGKYKESELRPFALLDRGMCHFMENENAPALAVVKELEDNYPGSGILDSSLNLKGNVYQNLGKPAEAETAYSKAKEIAESEGHGPIAIESIIQLISVYTKLERFEDAVKLYEEFTEKFSGDSREPEVVANALKALGETKQIEKGLAHMEDMIIRMGKDENVDLEKAITTYGKFYTEYLGADKLIARIKELREEPNLGSRVQAWLLILYVDTADEEFEGVKRTAEINAAMSFLSGFDMKDLAPYQLGRLGDYLAKAGRVAEAAKFFEEIIARPGDDGKIFALDGLGKVYTESPDKASQAKGVEYLLKVENYQDPTFTERAWASLARYYERTEQWSKAEEYWFKLVKDKSFKNYGAEKWFGLGMAREMQGNLKESVAAYLQVFTTHKSLVGHSSEAWRRACELQWKRGEKQNAYKLVRTMLEQMGYFGDMTGDLKPDIQKAKEEVNKAKKLYEIWRSELGATDPDVQIRRPK